MDTATCRHCERHIIREDGAWVDPEATGDDSLWRETCDRHDTFTAEHEPSTRRFVLHIDDVDYDDDENVTGLLDAIVTMSYDDIRGAITHPATNGQ